MRAALVGFSLLFLTACASDGPWFVDVDYGERLAAEAGSSPQPSELFRDTVDAVQLFRADDKVFGLELLRHREKVFETRQRAAIAALFKSFRKFQIEYCQPPNARTFHLIAYDSKLIRAAYMRVYICSRNGQHVATVRTLGDAGPLTTIELPAFLVGQGVKLD